MLDVKYLTSTTRLQSRSLRRVAESGLGTPRRVRFLAFPPDFSPAPENGRTRSTRQRNDQRRTFVVHALHSEESLAIGFWAARRSRREPDDRKSVRFQTHRDAAVADFEPLQIALQQVGQHDFPIPRHANFDRAGTARGLLDSEDMPTIFRRLKRQCPSAVGIERNRGGRTFCELAECSH